jgi:hypothetical protein
MFIVLIKKQRYFGIAFNEMIELVSGMPAPEFGEECT